MDNNRLEKKIDDLNDKVTSMDESLRSIDKSLAIYNTQLELHMRRSDLNEEAVELLKNQLKPIEKHIIQVTFLTRIGASVIGATALVYYITNILKNFNII